jgi:hypothetical protein
MQNMVENPAVDTVVDRQFVANLPSWTSIQTLINAPGAVTTGATSRIGSVQRQRAESKLNCFTVDG